MDLKSAEAVIIGHSIYDSYRLPNTSFPESTYDGQPQVSKLFEILQEFEFEIQYRPGPKMQHLHVLSRAVVDSDEVVKSVDAELAEPLDVLIAVANRPSKVMQQVDFRKRRIMELLEAPRLKTKQEENEVSNHKVNDGVLYRHYRDRLLLVVPKSMRKGIVIDAHEYSGHGVNRTISIITRNYWFSNLRRYVRHI